MRWDRSNPVVSNSFNFGVINSVDISQTEPIHITDPYSISYFEREVDRKGCIMHVKATFTVSIVSGLL